MHCPRQDGLRWEPWLEWGSAEKYVDEAEEVVRISDGLGISGGNENSDSALAQYRRIAGNKLLAIHAAESRDTTKFSIDNTGGTEVDRIVHQMKPDILVHMTHASESEIELAARNRIGIVVCPRANGVLGAGIPPIARMLK